VFSGDLGRAADFQAKMQERHSYWTHRSKIPSAVVPGMLKVTIYFILWLYIELLNAMYRKCHCFYSV